MDEEQRVNITPLAKKYRTFGWSDSDNRDSFQEIGDIADSQPETKLELYALGAIFIDRTVKRAYGERAKYAPFGLMANGEERLIDSRTSSVAFEDLDKQYPFVRIGSFMRDTLFAYLQDEMTKFELGNQPPQLQSAYQRLKHIIHSLEEKRGMGEASRGPREFIQPGIVAATNVMTGVLSLIPNLTETNNAEKLTQIARNSYPLIGKIAMSNIEKFGKIIDALRDRNFKYAPLHFEKEYFTLEGDNEKIRLAISNKGRERLKAELGITEKDFGTGQTPTIGCPAMVNFGGGSAVKILWDWNVEIAEKIFSNTIVARDDTAIKI